MRRYSLGPLLGLLLFLTAAGNARAGSITGTVAGLSKEDLVSVVVWVEGDRLAEQVNPPEVHPVNDQKDMTFVPRVLPVMVGSTVDFLNNDKIFHTVYSHSEAKRFNFPIMAGMKRQILFDKPGIVDLRCAVHHEMRGYIVVVPTPYLAHVKEDGTFSIERCPAGKQTLKVWHERLGTRSQEVVVPEAGSVAVSVQLTEGVTTK